MQRNCTVQFFHLVCQASRLSDVRSPRTLGVRTTSDIALRLFLQDGFNGVSMDQLVAEAGGSKATLYRYFPSKEALFEAIIDEVAAPAVNERWRGLGGRRAGGRLVGPSVERRPPAALDPRTILLAPARHRRAPPVPAPRDDVVRARRSPGPKPASAASWPPGEQQVTSTSTICRSPPSSSSAGSSATSNSAPRSACLRRPARTSKPESRQRSGRSSPRARVAELTVRRQSSISSCRSNPTISDAVGALRASAAMKSSPPPMYTDQKSTSVAANHRRSSGQNRSGLRHAVLGLGMAQLRHGADGPVSR